MSFSGNSTRKSKSSGEPRILDRLSSKKRAGLIKAKTISYKVILHISESDQYSGRCEATFEMGSIAKKQDLFIDYTGHTIRFMSINSQVVSLIERQYGRFIRLDNEYLLENDINIVIFEFENTFRNVNDYPASGFLRNSMNKCQENKNNDTIEQQNRMGYNYSDPIESNTFVFTHCKPGGASNVLPCFDQPNMKARFMLSVVVPSEWVCISNEMQKHQLPANSLGTIKVDFNPTAHISSYLFAFVAGPFHVINSNSEAQDIPISLSCRHELKEILHAAKDRLFNVILRSLNFFETYFGCKFPFSKYSLVFIPNQNNSRLMEGSIGVLMLSEEKLIRFLDCQETEAKMSIAISSRIASVWLGGLVSATYWSSGWLLESLSLYLGISCLVVANDAPKELKELSKRAKMEFARLKSHAYAMEGSILASSSVANKDMNVIAVESGAQEGDIHAKGAGIIGQIEFLVSEKLFREAIQTFIAKFAFENASAKKFFWILSGLFKRKGDFESMFVEQAWLSQTGINTCAPMFSPAQSQTTLVITQTAKYSNVLRRHKLKIAFFDEEGTAYEQILYVLPQVETTIYYKYPFEIKAVFLNASNHAYTKVIVDENSMKFFQKNMHKIQDPNMRNNIHLSLLNMVKDLQLSPQAFLRVSSSCLNSELCPSICMHLTNSIQYVASQLTPLKHSLQTKQLISEQYSSLFASNEENNSSVSRGLPDDIILFDFSESIPLQLSSYSCLLENREEHELHVNWRSLTRNESETLWSSFIQNTTQQTKPSSRSQTQLTKYMRAFAKTNRLPNYAATYSNVLSGIFEKHPRDYAVLFFIHLFPCSQKDLSMIRPLLAAKLIEIKISASQNPDQFVLAQCLSKAEALLAIRESCIQKFYHSTSESSATTTNSTKSPSKLFQPKL